LNSSAVQQLVSVCRLREEKGGKFAKLPAQQTSVAGRWRHPFVRLDGVGDADN
jgi:hypothetical protein